MRSVLRVFGPFLTGDLAAFEADLSWYQNLLGEVRDRQVQRPRLADAIGALPPELVLGPVVADVESALLAEQSQAREELSATLGSDRYRAMMRRFRELSNDPPTSQQTEVGDLIAAADAAYRKARKRLKKGAKQHDPEMLHRARKAAKRARYAAELVEPAVGKRATKHVDRLKDLQDVLGEHQDSVQSMRILLRLGATTGGKARRNGFTYGLLYQREEERQAQLIDAAVHLQV